MSKQPVTIRRVWEVECPKHGILDAPTSYHIAKRSRAEHYAAQPDCRPIGWKETPDAH